MKIPSPKEVFEDPSSHWDFLVQASDDDFEGQHFDRKEAGRENIDGKGLRAVRNQIVETISAFANSNVEGGLLVLGIASDGTVPGIDHLSERQRNSLTDFAALLRNHAAEAKVCERKDASDSARSICLVFVPYTRNGICETPERTPKAWTRNGSQNIRMTQEVRDQVRVRKNLLDFENTPCCPFYAEDLAEDVLAEFRKVFAPEASGKFSDERLLHEAGAIVRKDGEYWLTNAGLLFFASNPQRVMAWSYIRLLRFEVPSARFRKRGLPTFDQKFAGPLTKQIREARTFFGKSAFFKRYQKRKAGGGFIDEPEFPQAVIDEAVVNAVAHRDYRTGLPIECEAYTDAFIVKNPGRMLQRARDLPDEFSLSDTVLDSMPRNMKLLEWLKIMKDPYGTAYIQAISEGTKKMLEDMTNLGLPAPAYRLSGNETLIKLESMAEEREAAILAASQTESTEFGNLFPMRIRRGDEPVGPDAFDGRYREFMKTFRDVLKGNGWHIDRFGFSRIEAHRVGSEFGAPADVNSIVRFYPAYEFQVRRYFGHFYLCLDYRCQVLNVQKLSALAGRFPKDMLANRRCVAKKDGWREGRILEFDSEFAKVHFFDVESVEQAPLESVIPYCSLTMIERSLKSAGVSFDLFSTVRKYGLASRQGSARERVDKISNMIRHIAETLFPIRFGDMDVDLVAEPLRLIEGEGPACASLPVYRLSEPTVEFGRHNSSSDIRIGITKYGAYDDGTRSIEIVPVCLRSMTSGMGELIRRLKVGKYKYRGAERTFGARFSYSSIVEVDRTEDAREEIERLLEEHPDWERDASMKRIFLVHAPRHGYSKDDHSSPYYEVKRFLLEKGVPCQMVDTATLEDADWKDLNLALNIAAKCGVKPWVLPDSVPAADFFVGLSYTQSRDGRRIMGFANVFNSYGRWEFYSGNTSYFKFEERSVHLAQLAEKTLSKLRNKLSDTPQISFHYSARLSPADRDSILDAARAVIPEGTFTFVWINSHHSVRFYDNRPETDGSLQRGSYVKAGENRIYLSTTGYNPFRKALGTPKPLEISAWVQRPKGSLGTPPDLRVLALQVLSLTKLNWASTDSFCGEPITLKYAGDIAYLTAAFLRQSEPFKLHPALEKTPWFI